MRWNYLSVLKFQRCNHSSLKINKSFYPTLTGHVLTYPLWDSGIKSGSGGGHNARGRVRSGSQIWDRVGNDNKPRGYSLHFRFSFLNVDILHLRYWYDARREPLPLFRHVVHLNNGKCRLTMSTVKGRCARDVLPRTFNIAVFKSVKTNPATITHIYNESANTIEGCDVAYDISWRRACSLIKSATTEKCMPCPAQIHRQSCYVNVMCILINTRGALEN